MNLLKETISSINPSKDEAKKLAREKWDALVKPMGSLGTLEEATIKIAGMTGKVVNRIDKRAIVVMCSDNGVADEGVSSAPQIFTKVLTESMPKGVTGVATLGKYANADIVTVNVGVIGEINDPRIINRKIADGTKNFVKEPAMTYDEAIKSIEIGIEIGDKLYGEGYDILGTGEVGIGNTTTAAAVLSVLADLDVDITCGKGAGLTDEQHTNKKAVIRKGIELNKPNKEDPIDTIAKVGGFDIGGMCGLFLSAAKNKKPIVIDGFISSSAALCAVKLNPLVKEYIIPSHLSGEPGAKYVMEELQLKPMLNLGMRLGEGTGCPLAFQIIEAGMYTLENMGTFEEVSLSSSALVDIREE
ncbi:nicotinate-nucleotide-dimethylbenzimidazole phosphoribosyltransferase [Tissierella praeacuta DSM 18095]|uniref:Nicotinate-nucleotide--dimethylbenzimidazole phosphoribosyltransferase n=1 Tax=Tissierella praeacuta DSM 18095 TaxID=1123404 RepID=A0A1M4WW05_9FIRM|nr:nicotinate-nucleotide--dimethylbenzimidazole phosphoribosyltransferase [Tissierella praeacuta]SHE85378.1 nicotinate-nucleotide-dimethylbenzimidazole phosphoribosyltransferase [Tissierella praeacuta DSM 18095]SUP00414.1 Nicotinate-nucleotide--dimethylbenzimidazole phosphoribosyltransferase [Tissierella praeacuta]